MWAAIVQDKGPLWLEVDAPSLKFHTLPVPYPHNPPSFTFSHQGATPPRKHHFKEGLLYRKKHEKDGFALLRLLTLRIGWS